MPVRRFSVVDEWGPLDNRAQGPCAMMLPARSGLVTVFPPDAGRAALCRLVPLTFPPNMQQTSATDG